jgi:hypothetical protein
MENNDAQHGGDETGTTSTGLLAILVIVFGPSALTLWWVLHSM